jgi:membrane-associated phospholipid phosphatase
LKNKENKIKLFQLISFEVLLVAGLFLLSMFLFAYLAHEVVQENEKSFDDRVSNYFISFSNDRVISIMKFFSFFGNIMFLIPAYILLIFYFYIKKEFRYCVNIAIIAISSSALMFWLKYLFHRARPQLPLIKSFTYSFPSGHALSSFIFCSIIIYLVWKSGLQKLWKWLFIILLLLFTLTIGISRIILRMHYPTDVIAGFCLGIAWVILSFWLLRKIDYSNIFFKEKNPIIKSEQRSQ